MAMNALQFFKFGAHHASADTAAPAMAGVRFRAQSRVRQGFGSRREGEAVGARSELEHFAVSDVRGELETFDFGADARGKTAGIETLYEAEATASGLKAGPGIGGVVADRGYHSDTRDSHPARAHGCASGTSSMRAPRTRRFVLRVSTARVALW